MEKVIAELWKPAANDPFLSHLTALTFGLKPVFRLRWVFEFKDHCEYGGWNNPGVALAWNVKKSNLKTAVIETEHQAGWGILRALEIPGQDYVSTQWVSAQSLVVGSPSTKIVGLAMMNRWDKFTVLIDGRVTVRPLTDDEKKFNLHEYRY
jgi:hypothetical protein